LKKKETIFILGILAVAAILWLFLSLQRRDDYGTIKISVDGEVFGTYSLSRDQTIEIGDTNVCEIKNGEVRMTEATCPDHLCIEQQGPVTASGGMIVCLPNRVVIEAEGSVSDTDDSGVDVVT
jgi:hypothetical protein